MNLAFLARFEEVIALDPDPLAKQIFSSRLKVQFLGSRPPRLHWEEADLLGSGDVSELGRLLAEQTTRPAILFCNVLGQLRFLVKESSEGAVFERLRNTLPALLEGRSWASFHDRVSGIVRPGFSQPFFSDHRLSDQELLDQFYEMKPGERGELHDHLTEGLFRPHVPHTYFHWQIKQGWHHLIEAVRSP